MCSGDPPYVLQYNQQASFQATQPLLNQQSNYKQGSSQNAQPFKPQQQQQQQQPQMQQVAARNLQHSKSQQPQMQQVAAKNLQQGKPQQQQQQLPQQIKQPQQSIANSPQSQAQPQPQSQSQQQSQPQPQTQSQSQFQPQIHRLKPILKLPLYNQQQSAIAMQNNPVSSSQPLVPTPTSPLTTNSNPIPPTSNSTSEAKNENQVPEDTDNKIEEQLPRWRRKSPGCKYLK